MSNSTTDSPSESLIVRPGSRAFALVAIGAAIMVGSAQTAAAQAPQSQKSAWEFVAASGALIPTGAQRSVIKTGNLSTAQLSYVVNPAFAVTSTLGWARSREVAALGANKFDAFTYDLGAEARLPKYSMGGSKTISPFAGIGAGARSYNYRKLDVDATHDISAYGSVGGELGVRRVRVRVEARDYVSRFKGLNGLGAATSSNDVVVMAGLRLVTR